MRNKQIHSIHFIGIGGVGMSGIAYVACKQGMAVSGSDLRQSKYTDQLNDIGVTIYIGQSAKNIASGKNAPDVVVVSTAILPNNEELVEAQKRGLTIWHRAQMLAYLGRDLKTLAVAGTHGKTTSSSMLASVVDCLGFDPTFLIGGMVRSYGSNAHCGLGEYYVVEADESDKSFTYLSPYAVLITNIEADHFDHYKNLDEIYDKFLEFISSTHKDGVVVVCGDDEKLVAIARKSGHSFSTYGFSEECDYRIVYYKPKGVGSEYGLRLPSGQIVDGSIKQNPGVHNVLNACGVLSVVSKLGVDIDKAVKCLSEFAGVKRRFDLVGSVNDIYVVDDYAHHPTEIAATIKAAKSLDFNNIHVLFQPHRYSRAPLFTEVLKDEFSHAFDDADTVTFMDVYSAGEIPVPGITGKTFLNVVLQNPNHPKATYIQHRINVVPRLLSIVKPGDLIMTMGAGDVSAIGPQLYDELKKQQDPNNT